MSMDDRSRPLKHDPQMAEVGHSGLRVRGDLAPTVSEKMARDAWAALVVKLLSMERVTPPEADFAVQCDVIATVEAATTVLVMAYTNKWRATHVEFDIVCESATKGEAVADVITAAVSYGETLTAIVPGELSPRAERHHDLIKQCGGLEVWRMALKASLLIRETVRGGPRDPTQ